MMRGRWIVALWLCLAAGAAAYAAPPEGYTLVKQLGGITEYKLEQNGLHVLLLEDRTAPVVTFMVTYRVGSRNEAVGHTGATHLLEHLMFKGTPKFNKQAGTQIAAVLKNVGAYYNATTWFDRTNYFELVPRDQLELAIRLEADRMRNSFIRDEDRQPEMTVVRNEYERMQNNPDAVMEDQVFAMAFLAHPYHHSTIGWRSDIEGVSTDRLRLFYDTFYHPNNAYAVVIGDYDERQALELIRKEFGAHPATQQPIPTVYTTEPEQQGERRFELHRAGELGLVYVGQHVPPALHDDIYPLVVLARIASSGKTSRLYRALVDTNLAIDQDTSVYELRDPGLLITRATLAEGVAHKDVEAVIVKQFERLQNEMVTAAELATAKQKIRADIVYGRDGSFAVAAQLNEAIASATWETYVNYLARIEAVTPEAVRQVAKRYLDRQTRTVGYFVPVVQDSGAPTTQRVRLPMRSASETPVDLSAADGNATDLGLKAKGAPQDSRFVQRVKRQEFSNHARLLTLRTAVPDVVSFAGSLSAGDATSPAAHPMLADMTANMLDRGTVQLEKFAFSEKLEQVGAYLNVDSGTFTVDVNGRCLKQDLPLVMELLADMLRHPRFDPAELAKLKKERAAMLRKQAESTAAQAANAMTRLVFPAGYPFYTEPFSRLIDDLQSLTVDDLRKFHDATYGGRSLILVVTGDVDEGKVQTEFRKRFADWSGGRTLDAFAPVALQGASQTQVISMADKANVDIRIGHAQPVRIGHADYIPFALANRVLGASTLSSRLGLRLRDTEGLTYGVTSALVSASLADGAWYTSISVAPQNVERALASIRQEIDRLLRDGVTSEEFENEKRSMIGSFQVALGMNSAMLAHQIHFVEREGLGVAYLDDYVDKVRAATLEQVQSAIRNYLHPDRFFVTMAGSLAADGKPLPPKTPTATP